MTLLEATSTLIDAAKTWCPENDKHLQRAIKRVEKRLQVLQLRAAKALQRRRHKGWKDLQHLIRHCPQCDCEFVYGEFIKRAELNARGDILWFDCPECEVPAVVLFKEENMYMVGKQAHKLVSSGFSPELLLA